MLMQMFLREAFGVKLSDLPAAPKHAGEVVSAEFYGQLMTAVAALNADHTRWINSKQDLGDRIAEQVIQPWQNAAKRPPRILAVGVGEAYAEGRWIERGWNVLLHDGTDAAQSAIRRRHPSASFVTADMRGFTPYGEFDVITMIANDFVLDRLELTGFAKRMAASLSIGGLLIIWCPNILSARRMAIEVVRRLTGAHRRNGWIPWGWWRSISEFRRLASDTGMKLRHDLSTPHQLPLRSETGMYCLERIR